MLAIGRPEMVLVLGAVEALRATGLYVVGQMRQPGARKSLRTQGVDRSCLRLARCQPCSTGAAPPAVGRSDRGRVPGEQAALPDVPLRPLALVGLTDELRPEARQVLEALAPRASPSRSSPATTPRRCAATVEPPRPAAAPRTRSSPAPSWRAATDGGADSRPQRLRPGGAGAEGGDRRDAARSRATTWP